MEELKSFEEQLKNINKPKTNTDMVAPGVDVNDPNVRKVQVAKNLVLSFPIDYAGCGHIRNIFPFTYLNSVFAKQGHRQFSILPAPIFQQDYLARARTLYFQRFMAPMHKSIVTQYKKLQPNFKYKMVWELDDYLWGHNEEQGGDIEDGVPSYNFGARNISDEIKQTVVDIMNMMDTCIFSTEFLANYAKNVLNVKAECVVVQNTVGQFFWGLDKKPDIKKRITKPKVIYTGSPTHYLNPVYDKEGNKVIQEKLGDFNNAWKDWVIKNVKEDKIQFIVMGGLPWFLEEIKDKITVHGFIDSMRYHNLVKLQQADIAIMPLVPNNFNRAKSDIKAIEHYADGVPCIGTILPGTWKGPYENNPLTVKHDCTVEDIDKLVDELCEPKLYNKIKKEQYEKLYKEGRWTESQEFVKTVMNII